MPEDHCTRLSEFAQAQLQRWASIAQDRRGRRVFNRTLPEAALEVCIVSRRVFYRFSPGGNRAWGGEPDRVFGMLQGLYQLLRTPLAIDDTCFQMNGADRSSMPPTTDGVPAFVWHHNAQTEKAGAILWPEYNIDGDLYVQQARRSSMRLPRACRPGLSGSRCYECARPRHLAVLSQMRMRLPAASSTAAIAS